MDIGKIAPVLSTALAIVFAFGIFGIILFVLTQFYPESESSIGMSCPDCNIVPSPCDCPDCECNASCTASTKLKYVEGCHLPERYFSRPSKEYPYTGNSNIPSIFMGNKIVGVKVESKRDLHVGCFYGFTHEGQFVLHRLIGIYDSYLKFRGDNSDGIEKVQFEALEMLIREVKFK